MDSPFIFIIIISLIEFFFFFNESLQVRLGAELSITSELW